MDILGISAYNHDSAAAVIKDDEIKYAAQEERFSRKKYNHRFPINTWNQACEILLRRVTVVEE